MSDTTIHTSDESPQGSPSVLPANTVPSRPAPRSFRRAIAALTLLAFAVLSAAASATAVRTFTGPSVVAQAAERTPVMASIATPDEDAIKQVIERANAAQVQAIANGDISMLAEGATADYYQELARGTQDMRDGGVRKIELLKLEWGGVAVSGTSATATTFETWRTTYADGSVEQDRQQNEYVLVQDNGAWKVSGDNHPEDVAQSRGTAPAPGQRSPAPPAPAPRNPAPSAPTAPAAPPATSLDTSSNWSGYVATGSGTYTSVTGTWIVPEPTPTGTFATDATWVGIGGSRTRDLVQAGTQTTVTASGRVRYSAWVETLPEPSRPVPFTVRPGDSVTVTVAEQTSNVWQFSFTNNTTGETYQQSTTYASCRCSAEWIQEAPSALRAGILPITSFGTVTFTSGDTVRDGKTLSLAGAGARPVTLSNGRGGEAIAVPSEIGPDGSSFSVMRTEVAQVTSPAAPSVWLGIVSQPQEGAARTGVAITSVAPDSPAAAAGIRGGDVITAIDGRPTANLDALVTVLSERHPGDSVTLTVNRGGQSLEVSATLQRRPRGL